MLTVPHVGGVVLTARDVTDRRALEEQLAHQAFHDSLTGLANRALFSERITHAIERGVRRRNLFAVLFIDLDDFKTVNDSLGHAAGDDLLVEVAARIRGAIRPEDACARLGGDEFAVLIESIADVDSAVDSREAHPGRARRAADGRRLGVDRARQRRDRDRLGRTVRERAHAERRPRDVSREARGQGAICALRAVDARARPRASGPQGGSPARGRRGRVRRPLSADRRARERRGRRPRGPRSLATPGTWARAARRLHRSRRGDRRDLPSRSPRALERVRDAREPARAWACAASE